ncbi:MAG: hypothetical protein V1918_05290 [Planctomycetota bacterium]
MAEQLALIMDQARRQEGGIILDEQLLKTAAPQRVLAVLAQYEKDPSEGVQYLTYHYYQELARLHPSLEVRQAVVDRFTELLTDESFDWWSGVAGWMGDNCRASDFSEASRERLRRAVPMRGGKVIRLYGVADMQDMLPYLQGLLIDEEAYRASYEAGGLAGGLWYGTDSWQARLTRARLGVQEDIQKCLQLVESEKDEDRRVLRLLPDVGYIRQPAAIEYLKRYVYSEERLPRVKETAPGSPYAAYAIHVLCDALNNFPIRKDDGIGYTDDELVLCRQWLAEQTQWDIRR